MRTLDEIYQQVESTADFAGVTVIGPNTKGLFNNYPLHVVAVWGDCEAIRILVKAGAIIDQTGEHGFTPLMEAVAQGHRQAVELLLEMGAKATQNDDGQLPSEYAEIAGNEELAAYLRSKNF